MTKKHVPFAKWLFENEHLFALIATPERPIPTREELDAGLVHQPAIAREDWRRDLDRLVEDGLLEAAGQRDGTPYRLTKMGSEVEEGLRATLVGFVEGGFIELTDERDGRRRYQLTDKGKAAVRSDWQQVFDGLVEDDLIEVTGERGGQPIYALNELGRKEALRISGASVSPAGP